MLSELYVSCPGFVRLSRCQFRDRMSVDNPRNPPLLQDTCLAASLKAENIGLLERGDVQHYIICIQSIKKTYFRSFTVFKWT